MAEGLGRFHKKNKSTFLMTYCTLSVQYVVVLHLNTCVFENGVQKKIIYLLTETGSTCFDPPAKVFFSFCNIQYVLVHYQRIARFFPKMSKCAIRLKK